jgi:NAD-binding of NADP-dependent 3-hydroxyisobutyrate dehydrogenase
VTLATLVESWPSDRLRWSTRRYRARDGRDAGDHGRRRRQRRARTRAADLRGAGPPRVPHRAARVVNSSTGRSFVSEVVFGQQVVTGRYDTGFALGLLAKDVTIAAGIAEGADVEAPVCELVQRRWAEAADALGFGADHSVAHKQWWDVELSYAISDRAG